MVKWVLLFPQLPMDIKKLTEQYNFSFPPELIAKTPARPRDSARLLAYNRKTKKITFSTFADIGNFLPKNAVLVFNQTKVLPARLELRKQTGGKVKILYISQEKNLIKILSDRALTVGSNLFLNKNLSFTVEAQNQQFYFLKPHFAKAAFSQLLKKYGKTPLPPYIKNSPLPEPARRREYQTVFAKYEGSVAAPTAGLHFTKRLLKSLKKQGIDSCFVTLNVGLGTFAPLRQENLTTGRLHSEEFEIDRKTRDFLNKSKKQLRPIIAVGTTVVRTLESAYQKGRLQKLKGHTNLFIQPSFSFQFVDGIITNFHVPKSSLLMLVAAFAGQPEIMNIYQKAVKNEFRLFSFGDGMLLL